MTHATIVVIPCYNEARRFRVEPVRDALARDPSLHVLFADDGSTDGTGAMLREACASLGPRCQVHTLAANRGKAEAVRQAMCVAHDPAWRARAWPGVARVGFVGFWDADFATPLDELPRFQRAFAADPGLAMVIGARVKLLGRNIERRPVRHYLGRVFATAASVTLGLAVYDTQCGAKLFRGEEAWFDEVFGRPFISRWIFDVEIIARFLTARAWQGRPAGAAEAAIHELPLKTWTDVKGSKVKPRDFFVAFFELLALRRQYRSLRHRARPTS